MTGLRIAVTICALQVAQTLLLSRVSPLPDLFNTIATYSLTTLFLTFAAAWNTDAWTRIHGLEVPR